MKYYVVSDTHGFYSEMIKVLKEKGFFDEESKESKLILCGDAMDRGKEALKMQDFLYKLLLDNRLIYIRGNHEDLMMDMINNYDKYKDIICYGYSHHVSNGTFDTALQLTHLNENSDKPFFNSEEFIKELKKTIYVDKLIPSSINYFETENYIFVHGWIPCTKIEKSNYIYNKDWRNASVSEWESSRWINGMDAYRFGALEPKKTVVCGHYHSSYGHNRIEMKCPEFHPSLSIFTPFYDKGIIALDGCTAYSGIVNCIVLRE